MASRDRGVDAARLVLDGEELAVIAVEAPSGRLDSLTEAERAVCRLILSGRSNAEIARARQVSLNTVENQVASIFRKLDVASRTELAARLTAGG